MEKIIKICHVTSSHPPEDGRIFRRACIAAVKAGYETHLIQKGKSYCKNGVTIHGIGIPRNNSRLYLFTVFNKKAYQEALKVDADIYHLHDLELLIYALKLVKKGKKVIFDSHENYTEQIKIKPYLPHYLSLIISRCYDRFSKYIFSRIDGVTYPGLEGVNNPYDGTCKRVVTSDNYPWKEEMYDRYNENAIKEKRSICYIGGLDESRGITQTIKAGYESNCKVYLAGKFFSSEYRESLEKMKEYSCVDYLGEIRHEQIVELLQKVEIGVCLLTDVGQYYKMNNFPTKVYEYMSMGLPVILNDSPFNKEWVQKLNIGFSVNPNEIHEVSKAINMILADDELRMIQGRNGREAINNYFNWDTEQKKLINLYHDILSDDGE